MQTKFSSVRFGSVRVVSVQRAFDALKSNAAAPPNVSVSDNYKLPL